MATEGHGQEATRVVARRFDRVHVGARECSSVVALVVEGVHPLVQDLTEVWQVLAPPRMHHSVHEVEVRFADVCAEEQPEDRLWHVG